MYLSKKLFQGIAVCSVACTMLFTSCDNKKAANTKEEAKTTETKGAAPSGKIAYVDMDTLEAKYEYLKTRKAELEKETMASESEVGRMAQNLQNEYIAFQKKAQAGTLTQAEGEAGQKRLKEMEQNIESRRQTLSGQLMKKQETFNKDLQSRLDAYLLKYNANKGYDYILSYSKGGSILYVNKSLNITEDVVKGMNEESSAAATESKTETK